MKKEYLLLSLLMLSLIPQVWSQSIWNKEHLTQVKQQINEPYYAASYQALKASADALLSATPLSVMDKEKVAASGNKHDYLSQARYFWPDPTKPDGLPYINRDGQSNPELEKLDRNRLGETANRIVTLSLAWYFSGDECYAEKATQLIRVWFLDKKTRMNPHMEYAQIIPGRYNNKGRSYGLIDGYSFVEMLDGVALLESSKAFTSKDSKQLKLWFTQLLKWMIHSEQGIEEDKVANNHSVAYDAQIVAYSLYTGQREQAVRTLNNLAERRLFKQIEPDGKQPLELKRTLAFHYSQYNLTHFIDLFLMARSIGLEIDQATSADGRNFYRAMDFLAGYVGQPQSQWPYQQLSGWEQSQQTFCKDLYRVGRYLSPERTDYLQIYATNRQWYPQDRFNLLYVDATVTDHAFAFAEQQLQVAMKCADKARKEEKNAAKRRVIPRSIEKNGSLKMIHPHDWCSGFFPGSIWQVYAYTHRDVWRQWAISWTWPIEEAKWHGGTHDLGFMMNNSFGKAYELTNERSYRDVLLQSAKTLITRFNPTVGCIRSWDHNRDRWSYPVIIDNMMNLEMLFRATQLTGDSIYWQVAVSHALTTMKNHFRPDYSSYHVVDYNPETGEVRNKCTHQGHSDQSFWSRGQGWGLYGYALCYRFTKNPLFLQQSEGIADFFLNLPNMPADGIPYWDMNMESVNQCTPTDVNPDVPRDASAAALIASGLYELCTYVAPEKGKQYREFADKIVHSLYQHYQADPGSHYGFLLLHSTGHYPANSEVDVPLNYADYYYLEALSRKQALDRSHQ